MDRLRQIAQKRAAEKAAAEAQAAQQQQQQQQQGPPGSPARPMAAPGAAPAGSPARPVRPVGAAGGPPGSPVKPMPGSPMKRSPTRQGPMPGSPMKAPPMTSPARVAAPPGSPMRPSPMGTASPRAPGTPTRPAGGAVAPQDLTARLSGLSMAQRGSPAGTPSGTPPGTPRKVGPAPEKLTSGTPTRTMPGSPMRAAPGSPMRPAPGSPMRPAAAPGSGSPAKAVAPTDLSVMSTMRGTTTAAGVSPTASVHCSPKRISPHSITPPEAPPAPVEYSGKAGRKVMVGCNYIRLEQMDERGVFEYAVSFSPSVDSRDEKFKMMKQLEDVIGKVRNFDGTKLFLPIQLDPPSVSKQVVSPISGRAIKATVAFKGERHPGEQVVIQHFNMLFGRVMKILKFSIYNRKHYDPSAGHKIPKHKLEVWPGYVTAVDQYQGGLHLMLDVTHRVIRNENVKDVIYSLRNKGANMKTEVEKALLGATIITSYNNNSYKIDDILWDESPQSKFERDGSEGSITMEHYYKTRYNLQIKDLGQPLLMNRPKVRSESEAAPRAIWLVPELCMMTGLTDSMRNNFTLMKDVAAFTRVTPDQRMKSMHKFIKNVLTTPEANSVLTSWGLKLCAETAPLEARQLDPETLVFGKNQMEKVTPKGDWNRAATSKPMLTCVPLRKWSVLFLKKDEPTVMKFLGELKTATGKSGMTVAPPNCQALPDDRTDTFLKAAREAIQPQTDLVMTIVPAQRSDRYAAIKKLMCIERPVASQVIITKTISNEKRLQAVAQKVGIQINCKLGGEAWGCATATKIKGLMVFGMDVYKDASRKGAFVGMVATLNSALSRFHSGVAFQKDSGQFIADAIRPVFLAALARYKEVNNAYPRNIIVYRDGLGDSQIDFAAEHEADQFLRCFDFLRDPNAVATCKEEASLRASLTKETVPGFTYIVVQRRINTRIFGRKGAGVENPGCGTIVDHTITRARFKDFFLVPMNISQGTATPTHFVVVRENEHARPGGRSQFPADHVQRLSYMLTHMYFNWPGTVRVPAPCQYARKLVDLVGESLHSLPSDKLAGKLFYL